MEPSTALEGHAAAFVGPTIQVDPCRPGTALAAGARRRRSSGDHPESRSRLVVSRPLGAAAPAPLCLASHRAPAGLAQACDVPLVHDSMLLRRDDEAVVCHGGELPERKTPCPVFQCSLGGTALPSLGRNCPCVRRSACGRRCSARSRFAGALKWPCTAHSSRLFDRHRGGANDRIGELRDPSCSHQPTSPPCHLLPMIRRRARPWVRPHLAERSAATGHGLVEAVRRVNEGVELLAEARRDGS